MKSPNENPLLRELLADDQLAEVRRASLDASLSLIRRRRRARLVIPAGGLVALVAWAVSAFLLQQRHSVVALVQTNPPSLAQKPSLEPAVKVITDEELFALFPDRAVALIGKPGRQEFVVLDAPVRN